MDNEMQNTMKEIWESAGRPGYIQYGGNDYQVLTPDGPQKPVFVPVIADALYGQTSTAKMTPEHSKKKASPYSTPKVTKTDVKVD